MKKSLHRMLNESFEKKYFREDYDTKLENEIRRVLKNAGYDITVDGADNYISAAAEYIDEARGFDGYYSVEEWLEDTEVNYPEDLLFMKTKETVDECDLTESFSYGEKDGLFIIYQDGQEYQKFPSKTAAEEAGWLLNPTDSIIFDFENGSFVPKKNFDVDGLTFNFDDKAKANDNYDCYYFNVSTIGTGRRNSFNGRLSVYIKDDIRYPYIADDNEKTVVSYGYNNEKNSFYAIDTYTYLQNPKKYDLIAISKFYDKLSGRYNESFKEDYQEIDPKNHDKYRALLTINYEGGNSAEHLYDLVMKYQPDSEGPDDLTDETIEKVYADLVDKYKKELDKYGDDAEVDYVAIKALNLDENLDAKGKLKEDINKKYKVRFYYQDGEHKGDLEKEEFYKTKEDAVKAYRKVFKKSNFSLNPTVWEKNGKEWKRLQGNQLTEEIKVKEVFHNDNGTDYDIIERSKSGKHALLNKGPKWIIAWNCPESNEGSWGQGHYFFSEEDARKVWEDKYLNESKNKGLKSSPKKALQTLEKIKKIYEDDNSEVLVASFYSDFMKLINDQMKEIKNTMDTDI